MKNFNNYRRKNQIQFKKLHQHSINNLYYIKVQPTKNKILLFQFQLFKQIYNQVIINIFKLILIKLINSSLDLHKSHQILYEHFRKYLVKKTSEKVDNIYFLQNQMNEQSFVFNRNQNSIKKEKRDEKWIQLDKKNEYRLVFSKLKILQFISSQSF
ncbi:unnamed protein product [Paramecium sonneborni]|uniref:Uncharacterized protein n=1 Tax=Paramecium sonneborni TaxID=65129 RepID=A0A8S1NNW6_9CILI|nr:unnamed protein product [Paramecium sonneborni]